MKKLLALLLSLMLMLSFTACGGKDKDADATAAATEESDVEKDAEEKEEEKEPGQEVVEAFLNAIATFNFEEAVSYIDAAGDVELPFANLDEVKQSMIDAMGEELSAEYVDAFIYFIDAYTSAYSNSIEYTIDDVQEEDDKIVYTLTINHADMSSIDMEAMEQELAEALLESGDITADMSEDDIFLAMYEPMSEAFVENIENADTLTDTVTIVLIESDGEYIISDSESDAGMFMDALYSVTEFSF